MTAQMNDMFRYGNATHSISGISEGELFSPQTLEMHPQGRCSACWRGYLATYAVVDRRLVVADLSINLALDDDAVGPTINGVTPTRDTRESIIFDCIYVDLNYHVEYTGGVLLTKGFIQELYVHMGFHPAWKYKQVLELVFENGRLVQEFDRSAAMAEVRRRILDSNAEAESPSSPTNREIRDFVERAFDLRYDRGLM